MLFRIFFLGEIRKMYYYKFHKQLARTTICCYSYYDDLVLIYCQIFLNTKLCFYY